MQLQDLKPEHKRKNRKRIGRGGKKGTYVGRGLKGQKSRAGAKTRPGFAGGDTTFIKRLPKQRGVIGKSKMRKGVKLSRYQIKPVVLNLEQINKNFKEGETVSPKTLLKKGLIEKNKTQRVPDVKILGKGELKKKVIFKGVELSKSLSKKLK